MHGPLNVKSVVYLNAVVSFFVLLITSEYSLSYVNILSIPSSLMTRDMHFYGLALHYITIHYIISVYQKLVYAVLTLNRDISHEIKFKYLIHIVSQYLLVACTYAWLIPVALRSKA